MCKVYIFLGLVGGDADVVDESSAQEDFEEKLKECIEGTSQKRFES